MPTLEQIKDKMKKLQEQAEKLIAKRAQSVLTDIRKLMEEHGLTTADIAAHSTGKKQRGRPVGSKPNTTATRKVASSSVVTGVTPPKYRNPKTGTTWTGHGRAPAWIADVKDRSKFLIDDTDGGAVRTAKTATKKTVAVGSAVALKGQRKGPQPAKYLDPKIVSPAAGTRDTAATKSVFRLPTTTIRLTASSSDRARHRVHMSELGGDQDCETQHVESEHGGQDEAGTLWRCAEFFPYKYPPDCPDQRRSLT